MTKKTLVARLPALPAPEFFRDATHTIRTVDGGALLSFDPKTRAGLIYEIASGTWSIAAPVDFHSFVLLAFVAGWRLADDQEARCWYEACGAKAEHARRGMN